MTVRSRVQVASCLLALLSVGLVAVMAQQPAANPAEALAKSLGLSQPMPVDPQITMGTFPNGLRYYIRTNKLPERRAELRLAVNAGSVLEDDDQQGLAHFVEHMAFNGTTHFPKQEIVDVHGVDRHAVRAEPERLHELRRDRLHAAGADRQAGGARRRRSSSSRTGRTTSRSIRRRSTRSAASSSRSGGSAAAPARACSDKQFPILFKGSRYAERLPIGKKEIIETFKHETLKRFYTRLVPAGPDGRRRRRRLRQGRRRGR